MLVDMPLEDLEHYTPPLTHRDDFDAFWEETLAEQAHQPLDITRTPIDYPVEQVRVEVINYAGFGASTRVYAWLLMPSEKIANLSRHQSAIVVFHGYSQNRSVPMAYLHWVLQGFSILAIDIRGQDGDTVDRATYPSGSALGHMTQGISDPYAYYYRFVYMDAVRAIAVIRSLVDITRIFVTGPSQGGGLTLAVAALARGITGVMPDVPYLAHFRRAVTLFSTGPYQEFVNHWKLHPDDMERDFGTLSYFDVMNFAPRITCPVLMSVALQDTSCPPSTAFAVYHHLASAQHELAIYPFQGHEGGGARHEEVKYRFIRHLLGGKP